MRKMTWFLSCLFLAMPAGAASSLFLLESAKTTTATAVAALHGLTVVRLLEDGNSHLAQVTVPNATARFVAAVKADPAVVEFEPDEEVSTPEKTAVGLKPSLSQLSEAITDTRIVNFHGSLVRQAYSEQFSSALIHLPDGQNAYGFGGGIVAIIDTGVDPYHPALAHSIVPGYDFLRNVPGVPNELADLLQSTVGLLDQSTVGLLDQFVPAVLNQSTVGLLDQSTVGLLDAAKLPSDFGHGTMVAGLIHLVAPNAWIMPLRAFQPDGTGQLSDIIRAIYFAVDHKAKVINMSFSLTSSSTELATAIKYATSHKVICVAAAGNMGKRVVVYPAGLPGVIGVGSTSPTDLRSIFSNFGVSSVRMGAPGEALITTYPAGHYAGVWGTSFSAALVSGTAALMLSITPSMSGGDFADALEHGKKLADNVDEGDARLDVLEALIYCSKNH